MVKCLDQLEIPVPVITPDAATVHDLHGSTFTSYLAPSRGSEQLCAWRLDVPATTVGVAHRVTHEEVLLVLDGTLHVHLDGARQQAGPGDVVRVPAGSLFRVDTGASAAGAWVVTSVGLEAVTADGTRIAPPWTT